MGATLTRSRTASLELAESRRRCQSLLSLVSLIPSVIRCDAGPRAVGHSPLEPWDSLICTSKSALQVVQEAMSCMHERLERRFQQTLPPPKGPQLSLISLGIDPEPYHWEGDANRQEQRLQARQQLGISSSARVVLFLGRLSFHSKAHSLPLYRAIDRLSAEHELLLLECGHIFNSTSKRPTTSYSGFTSEATKTRRTNSSQ